MSWAPVLPELTTLSWLAPALVGWVGGTVVLAAWLRRRHSWRVANTRKILHVSLFTAAALLLSTLGFAAVNALAGVAVPILLWAVARGPGHAVYDAVARPDDAGRRGHLVLLPLGATAVGGIVSVGAFGEAAAYGFLACGWGDAAGEVVGSRWGRHRYRVPNPLDRNHHRSLEGSAAVWLASAVGALVVAVLGPGPLPPIALGALIAAVASSTTIVEALSGHGVDNLTVQVAASASAFAVLRAFDVG